MIKQEECDLWRKQSRDKELFDTRELRPHLILFVTGLCINLPLAQAQDENGNVLLCADTAPTSSFNNSDNSDAPAAHPLDGHQNNALKLQEGPALTDENSMEPTFAARADVWLSEQTNTPCYVQTSSDSKVHINGELVSINGTTARGRSMAELQTLLWGAPNSAVEIVWLQQNSLQKSSVPREIIKKEGVRPLDLTREISDLNDIYDAHNPSSWHASSLEQENLDLLAVGYIRKSLKNDETARPKLGFPGSNAARLTILYDTLGRMAEADSCLKLLMADPSFDLNFDLNNIGRPNESLALIDHLIITGRTDEVSIFCRKFLKRVQEGYAFPTTAPEISSQLIKMKLAQALISGHRYSKPYRLFATSMTLW